MESLFADSKLTVDMRRFTVLRGPAWTRTEQTRGRGLDRERLWAAANGIQAWDPDPEPQEAADG